jgi:mRNA interferase RelE/StbE
VRSAIRELLVNPSTGSRLHHELEGLRKYPVHRYRIVYGLDSAKKVIDIVAVGQRRSIYEEVAELLRQEK